MWRKWPDCKRPRENYVTQNVCLWDSSSRGNDATLGRRGGKKRREGRAQELHMRGSL